ncbi:MAG: pilus assembly protein [Planctomycetales bacterium]|nr:pilus assembly protein [Planctomycetales bacterium]
MYCRRRQNEKRDGLAAVEFAILTPLLFLIIAGTMEICSALFLQEALTVCAYEGARTGAQRKATQAQVIARVQEVLTERGIVGGDVQVDPAPEAAVMFQPITVTVTAPTTGNTILPLRGWYSWMGSLEFDAEVVMVKEFSDVVAP